MCMKSLFGRPNSKRITKQDLLEMEARLARQISDLGLELLSALNRHLDGDEEAQLKTALKRLRASARRLEALAARTPNA